MKISVIIPSFNEEKTILEIIKKVKDQKVFDLKKEVIVVDDGSMDNSYNLLRQIDGIILLRHEKNMGKGFAIRTGLKKASGDVVIIQDADLELSPEDYPSLIEPILKHGAQVVYGSRLLGRKNVKHGLIYYSGGRFVTFAANFLYNLNLTDEPIGYKVFRRELLLNLNLECKRFEFCPEVTAKIAKKKIKIYEVPVKYFPRSVQEGKKLRMGDGLEALWTLIKYKFKN